MSKRMVNLGLVVVLAAVALIGVPRAAAQEDDCLQKGGMWDAAQQKCLIDLPMEVKIDYPLELSKTDFMGQVIDQFMADQRAQFLNPLVEEGFFYTPGILTLQIDYETADFSDQIVGLKFTVYTFTGGAHGMTTITTYTFDRAQQRVLSLDDLFVPGSDPLSVIGPIVEDTLKGQLGEMVDLEWLHKGSGEDPANYTSWIITPEALTFFFDPYQVAAYAAGAQTVTIPLEALRGILAAPFNGG